MCKDDGAKPATASQSQTNAPWSGALPYINQGLTGAQNLYQQGGQQYYPGQTYAGTNDALNSGINQLNGIGSDYSALRQGASNGVQYVQDRAQQIGQNGTDDNPGFSFFQNLAQGKGPGLSTLQDYADGKYLSADNPYFQQMSDNIKAQVLPTINGAFSQAGRGVSGLAGRAQGQGLGDAIGSLAYQNYQQGLGQQQSAAQSLAGFGVQGGQGLSNIYSQAIQDRLSANNQQLQAAQLAPSIQNMGINAGNASLLAGTTAQGLQQGALTDNQTRWNAMQNQPYQNLQDYIRNITGQISGTGQSNSSGTSTPATPSFFNQALGGALGAASFFV